MSVVSQYFNNAGDEVVQGTVNSFFKETTLLNTEMPVGFLTTNVFEVTVPSGLWYFKFQPNLNFQAGTNIANLMLEVYDEDGDLQCANKEIVMKETAALPTGVEYRITKVFNIKKDSAVFTCKLVGNVAGFPVDIHGSSRVTCTKIGL